MYQHHTMLRMVVLSVLHIENMLLTHCLTLNNSVLQLMTMLNEQHKKNYQFVKLEVAIYTVFIYAYSL